jgi:DNA-binding transcriptional regulator YiaG
MDPKKLIMWREYFGLTIAQMSRAMGVHRNTYTKWESGERTINAAAARLVETMGWLADVGWLSNYLDRFAKL